MLLRTHPGRTVSSVTLQSNLHLMKDPGDGVTPTEEHEGMTLDQLQPGSICRIRRLSSEDRLGRRLLAMGVCPGSTLRVVRNAPLRDPVEVEIDGRFLSLRRAEARFIEVEAA